MGQKRYNYCVGGIFANHGKIVTKQRNVICHTPWPADTGFLIFFFLESKVLSKRRSRVCFEAFSAYIFIGFTPVQPGIISGFFLKLSCG